MKPFRAICLLAVFVSMPAVAANDPFTGVGKMIASGRAKDARERIVKAREAAVADSDKRGEALALLFLGMVDAGAGNAVVAREELQEATAKFTAAGEYFGGFVSLALAWQLERDEGQLDAAIAVHERAFALLRKAAEPQSRLSLELVKRFASTFDLPQPELGPLAAFPEIVKPLFLKMLEVIARDAYGYTLVEAGQLEKAEEQLTQARATGSMFFGMFEAPISRHMGDLRRAQWRLDEAREHYMTALDAPQMVLIPQAAPDIAVLRRLAELEMLNADLDAALAWNDRALKVVRESGDRAGEASLLRARGSLLGMGGRIDDALSLIEEALKIATTNGNLLAQGDAQFDLGVLNMLRGKYQTSAIHFQKSIGLYQAADAPHLETSTWILLAEVLLLLESHDSADVALQNARALASKSSFKLAGELVNLLTTMKEYAEGSSTVTDIHEAFRTWWAMPERRSLMFSPEFAPMMRETIRGLGFSEIPPAEVVENVYPMMWMPLMLKARTLIERGEYRAVREVLHHALPSIVSADHRAGVFAMIGVAYLKEGKLDEAVGCFVEATETLDRSAGDVKVEELLASYLGSGRRWYYDYLIEMLVQQRRPFEAFAQAERARARAFLLLVGNHRLNAARGADPKLVREAEALRTHLMELERQARLGRPADAQRLSAELKGARQRYETLMIRVKVSSPEYAALTAVEPLPVDAIQSQLPPDTTVISYFLSPMRSHAWVVTRDAAYHSLLPRVDAQRILCWADGFRPRFDERGVERVSSHCRDAATAEDAFQALIAPLLPEIRTAKIMLVPHGVLHYVPFAALRNPATGRYLIEDYTLTYAPSASALRFLRSNETPVDGSAIVMGDPVSPLPSLKRLPGAALEASSIARMLGAKPRLGAEAREALLYDLGGKVDLVHLAAHGIYDPDNPIFSRIALAADEKHDGSLTVDEILSSVDLSGVNLVVLAACRSAAGARSAGDEVVGLTRALLYAGTPGVISTLWNIDDAASAGLMVDFYRRLGEGEAVADALRQAQLTVLQNERHRDPKYWAAFTLYGDPQGRWKKAAQPERME